MLLSAQVRNHRANRDISCSSFCTTYTAKTRKCMKLIIALLPLLFLEVSRRHSCCVNSCCNRKNSINNILTKAIVSYSPEIAGCTQTALSAIAELLQNSLHSGLRKPKSVEFKLLNCSVFGCLPILVLQKIGDTKSVQHNHNISVPTR